MYTVIHCNHDRDFPNGLIWQWYIYAILDNNTCVKIIRGCAHNTCNARTKSCMVLTA